MCIRDRIYAILALGVYITYKILDFPDLTVDGSFPLGAAVTAALITGGMNPYLTLPVSFLAGVLAGICTGLIHVKCKVRDLLSGIIMMLSLIHIYNYFMCICAKKRNNYMSENEKKERETYYNSKPRLGGNGPSKIRQQFNRGMTYFLVIRCV